MTTQQITTTYAVAGMTCAHCVAAVTEQVQSIAGVTTVAVDLPTGALTVTSDRPLEADDIGVAVDQAGYQLT